MRRRCRDRLQHLRPHALGSAARHGAPERFLVAHPFNPVYLLPLVELVGGRQTSTAALDAASTFFTYIGMHVLRVRREVPGHLTDGCRKRCGARSCTW